MHFHHLLQHSSLQQSLTHSRGGSLFEGEAYWRYYGIQVAASAIGHSVDHFTVRIFTEMDCEATEGQPGQRKGTITLNKDATTAQKDYEISYVTEIKKNDDMTEKMPEGNSTQRVVAILSPANCKKS